MRLTCMAVLILTTALAGSSAVVVDRIAVVVNRHPIKLSDIDRDVRLTDFLNKANLSLDAASKKTAEERLVDQQIIRTEVATGGYGRATDADANALLDQIRKERYAGSDPRLREALSRYGLTEDQLREQLLWQLTVLRFINERFRTGILVTDEDVQKYYESHRAAFREPLEKAAGEIRNSLEGEQVNQQFEQWLGDSRKRAQIDYKKEALP